MQQDLGSNVPLPPISFKTSFRIRHAAGVAFVALCGIAASVVHMGDPGSSRVHPYQPASRIASHSHVSAVPWWQRWHASTETAIAPGDVTPFTRGQVIEIVKRWRKAGPVGSATAGPVYTSKYSIWKQRAVAQIAAFEDQGKFSAARNAASWIAAYEAHERWKIAGGAEPVEPRSTPATLAIVAGGPAPTAFRGLQSQFAIALPGVAQRVILRDHPVDPDYPYLINPTGVADEGTVVSERPDAAAIFRAAKLGPEARKVFLKVSEREGGFEAVNTYDTGYVSVGFIQFTTMEAGTGSLISVLERMREQSPKQYAHYFQSFGIDVDANHTLTVVEPGSGAVLHGADAVNAVQHDNRLIAVFYHAGQGSRDFAAAQIGAARERYYAPEHRFSVPMAKVVDYSDPWNPVPSYVYGDEAIAKAKLTVEEENRKPWTAPEPQPIPLAPSLPVTPLSVAHPAIGRPMAAAPARGSRNVGPLDHVALPLGSTTALSGHKHDRETDQGEGQDLGTGGAMSNAPSVVTAASPSQQPVGPPAPLVGATKPLPSLPFVGGAPTARQVRRSEKLPPLTMASSQTVTPPPYHGPRYLFEQLAPLEGAYGDIFRSEAGRTAITDRCIQRGFEIGPKREGLLAKFTEAVSLVGAGERMTVKSLSAREADLIAIVQNRIMVLADPDLSQPAGHDRVYAKTSPRKRSNRT
ncbi:MAG TPA: hypothetical protein VGK19_20440 [Capsulimonadaceae bacterium]